MPEWLNDLIHAAGGTEAPLSPSVVALRLGAACVLGWLLAFTYRRAHTGEPPPDSIPQTQILLCMGGALIWLVVGDNLVRAFGLAGTIGLIRYRTRIRDPKDTTVLLFSMVLGMACGLGQYVVAAIGAGFTILTLLLLATVRPPRPAEPQRGGQADAESDTSE